MNRPRRGEVWIAGSDPSITVLVISSTVYNEIPDEPTVLVVPVVTRHADTGFTVDVGEGQLAITGLVTHLRKAHLVKRLRQVDVQTLTDVNNMLFKVLATPDR